MAFFAPLSLLALLPVWYSLIITGFMAMYWALGMGSWDEVFRISGSSLLTLGFATGDTVLTTILMFSEATIGLILVALLIAYLPTMYSAFSRRESAVTLLEVRAGDPPSPVEMLKRFHRIHGLQSLNSQWVVWETWFADIEETHTSFPALVFFRSPQKGHSWVTAGGAVLDAAAVTVSAVEIPHDPQADLCIRAGYLALRHIADYFSIPYTSDPHPDDPISISREEFDAAVDELVVEGLPIKADRERAWRDYAGWRVNYDSVLIDLAQLTMAPWASWSSDRSTNRHRVRLF